MGSHVGGALLCFAITAFSSLIPAAAAISAPPAAQAQAAQAARATPAAAVTGRVLDAQGGAVRAASLVLTPSHRVSGAPAEKRTIERRAIERRAIEKRATTDASGTFTFVDVPDGDYALTVEAPNFQTWTGTVTVRPARTALDITLEVAGVSEGVTVAGTTPLGLSTPVTTASRLGLTPLETPASVAVISGETIRNLGTPTLIVAKSLAPGVTSSAPMGSGGNVLNARGFTGQNSVKQLFNGMEIYNAGGVVSFPFDPWNVDHLDTLYGPASVLYGSGAIGGAVNVVPKRPDPRQRRHDATISIGSFGTWHGAVGSTGPINERLSYRVDVSQYISDHWVERGDSDSLAVSGSLRYDASDRLRFTLSNDFGNQNPSTYLGTPVLNNAPVAGLLEKNYNLNDAALNFTDNWTNLETIWTVSPWVSVHNNTYFMYHDRVYRDVTSFAYVPANATVRRTSFRDINDTYETQAGNTGFVKIAGRLFGRRNDTVVGLDLNRNYYHRNDNVRGGTSIVDALTFAPGNYRDFYAMEAVPFYRMHVNQAAAFAENQLHLTDRLSFVIGARRDSYDVDRFDNQNGLTTTSDYQATGWNTGAVFDLMAGLAIYGQYAEGSDPVNSFTSLAANQQGFNLSPGRQVEAGVKQSAWQKRLEWTFATYRLIKEDLLTPSVQDPTRTEQAGQQSSRGVEGSVSLSAGPVRVIANGTTLNARFDDFKATVSGAVISLNGNVPTGVPEQSANLLVFWDAAPAWQVRAVLRYVGRRFSDNTNAPATRIPSYHVLDLGVRWRATARLDLDLRLDNVTDEIYADSGNATNWLLGAPRGATVSAFVRF
jgi:iron complex outermembrane receptor protein